MKFQRKIKWVKDREFIVPEKPDFNTVLEMAISAEKRKSAIRRASLLTIITFLLFGFGYFLFESQSDDFYLTDELQTSTLLKEIKTMNNDSLALLMGAEEKRNSIDILFQNSILEAIEEASTHVSNNKIAEETDSSMDSLSQKSINEKVKEPDIKISNTKMTEERVITTETSKVEFSKSDSPNDFKKAYPLVSYDSLYGYLMSATQISRSEISKDSIDVKIHFYIEINGRPSSIKVFSDLPDSTITSIRDIVLKMPDWHPATLNGESVKTKLILPMVIIPDSLNVIKK